MTAFRWCLVLGFAVAAAIGLGLVHRLAPSLIGGALQATVPAVDPESLRASVVRLPSPAGPRSITVEMPVVAGASAWPELSAEARFSAGPASCLRRNWSRGSLRHIERVSLPVQALGRNRFVVQYHDHVLAPGDLYGHGVCRWFFDGIRLVARAVPDVATGQRRLAHIHIGLESVHLLEPQVFACAVDERYSLVLQCVRRGTAATESLDGQPEVSLSVAKPVH